MLIKNEDSDVYIKSLCLEDVERIGKLANYKVISRNIALVCVPFSYSIRIFK